MIQIYRFLYQRIFWPILKSAFFILHFFNRKIARGWEMRRRSKLGLRPWQEGSGHRRPVWFHCASGEFEYAKPVLELFKKQHPEIPTLVTFFSPSIEKAILNSSLVDIALPMPWDTTKAWREFFDHHKPRMLLIARTDTWPEMLTQAKKNEIPSLLFAATLTESSGRSKGLARPISRWIFSLLSEIFCVSENDLKCFKELGAGEKTRVEGDTRYDQVQARLNNPKSLREEHFRSTLPCFVAGSTWPEDEEILLTVISRFRKQIQFVLVPHEPTPEHLQSIESKLDSIELTHKRYSNAPAFELSPDVLVIDQIGILAELYSKAKFAFVGGSYRKTVHSVMEPLAAGCLTFVGPKILNNREAVEFAKIDLKPTGNFSPVEICQNSDEICEILVRALREFTPAASKRIREEINSRSNKSQLVLNWINSHLVYSRGSSFIP